ncbi:hypothetical protein HPB50_020640 [Hyalomma asiaticum]|uniref:Uncharacterized protein n=1 Tax=Hyalomma asiaticum TaxID=266040 RepID=A0ACB7S8N5_HYAAI|nr:hypothetical protein HPB50_020640 [Hyalomma asiaticum]
MVRKLFKWTFPGVSVEALGIRLRSCSGQLSQLHAADLHHSQLDKEGSAFMFTVELCHQYIWGQKLEATKNHKPLLGLLGPYKAVAMQTSLRVVHWALKMSAYTYHMI